MTDKKKEVPQEIQTLINNLINEATICGEYNNCYERDKAHKALLEAISRLL